MHKCDHERLGMGPCERPAVVWYLARPGFDVEWPKDRSTRGALLAALRATTARVFVARCRDHQIRPEFIHRAMDRDEAEVWTVLQT